jgi:hypothetical protein
LHIVDEGGRYEADTLRRRKNATVELNVLHQAEALLESRSEMFEPVAKIDLVPCVTQKPDELLVHTAVVKRAVPRDHPTARHSTLRTHQDPFSVMKVHDYASNGHWNVDCFTR